MMKIRKAFTLTIAAAGLLAFALPVDAQSRGDRRGGNSNRGDMHRGGGDHNRGDGHFHHGGGRVNFFFGGFGYPFYGYPYYGYPYGYAPYGYGYPVGAYYSYDPRGIYQGQVVRGAGNRLSLAAQVQQQLAAVGYYHGAIDGIVGEGTRRAIRNYERDNGLPVDGQIDDRLLAAMDRG
jgi:hypothetical protein